MPDLMKQETQVVGIITKLEHTISIHRCGGHHWWRRLAYKDAPPDITEIVIMEVTKKDGSLWTVTVQGCPQEFIDKCQKAYDGKWEATFTITQDV